MAWLMTGSAKIRAKTNASSPAMAPASTPRRMSFFSMTDVPGRSVAGEAEEVTRVVHELVDHHGLAEHRRGALIDTDEVVHRQRDHGRADQPQHGPRDRQGNRAGDSAGCGHTAHVEPPPGSCVPSSSGAAR